MGDDARELPRWGRRARWWFTRVLLPTWGALVLGANLVRLLGVDLGRPARDLGLVTPLTVLGWAHLAVLVGVGLAWLAAEVVTGFRGR